MGLIITFTGPSGSGKSTIVEHLIADENKRLVTSSTTRAKRRVDLPGEYSYLSNENFDAYSRQGAFLWTAGIATGSRYGTRKTDLDAAIANEHYNFLVLVPEVIPTLREYALPRGARLVHLWIDAPPHEKMARMLARGETQENATKRAKGETTWRAYLDSHKIPYTAIENPNGKLDETIAQVRAIIEQEPPSLPW